jgi:hypothetical protein
MDSRRWSHVFGTRRWQDQIYRVSKGQKVNALEQARASVPPGRLPSVRLTLHPCIPGQSTRVLAMYSGEAVNGVLHGRAYECRVFEAHNYVHHKDFGPRLTFFHEYCLDVPWP